MKTILLWPVALLLAMGFLASGRRRALEARVLRGKMSPKLLRMVVLILVALGAGRRAEAQAQPAAPRTAGDVEVDLRAGNTQVVPLSINGKRVEIEDHEAARSKEFPAALTDDLVKRWAFEQSRWSSLQTIVAGTDSPDTRTHTESVEALVSWIRDSDWMKQLNPVLQGNNPTLDDITAAANEMAGDGLYNLWGVTFLWRKSQSQVKLADVAHLADVYGHLEDCLRAENALRLAQARCGPIVITGWMSKAGPRLESVVLPANFLATAEKLFATTDAGLFETEGVISFSLPATKSGAMLLRRGQKIELGVKDFVRLRRLDILLTGDGAVTVTHRLLGEMVLPANTVVTARNVASFLTDDARKKIGEWTAAALDGDNDALQLLEMVLPAAATSMREALAAKKDARGAAAVRMVLQEFDGE